MILVSINHLTAGASLGNEIVVLQLRQVKSRCEGSRTWCRRCKFAGGKKVLKPQRPHSTFWTWIGNNKLVVHLGHVRCSKKGQSEGIWRRSCGEKIGLVDMGNWTWNDSYMIHSVPAIDAIHNLVWCCESYECATETAMPTADASNDMRKPLVVAKSHEYRSNRSKEKEVRLDKTCNHQKMSAVDKYLSIIGSRATLGKPSVEEVLPRLRRWGAAIICGVRGFPSRFSTSPWSTFLFSGNWFSSE